MPQITAVAPSLDFPLKASAVIIGAGIIGITTALELQARGLDVVVVEKGEVAAEQSSRNWGWCRQMGRDPREIPLIKVALELWRGMNARIGAETGFRTCGVTYLAKTEAEMAGHEKWYRDHAKPHGLATQVLTSPEIGTVLPGASAAWAGALFTRDDGRAEPFQAVPAMAEFFKQQGGKIFTGCAARGIETSAGRVSAVVTERGVIATDTVVLAGGYWSERFLANLNIRFPQSGVISSVLRTNPIEAGHSVTFAGDQFAARKRLDGGWTVANGMHSVAELTPQHFRYFKDFLPILMLDVKAVKLKVSNRLWDEFLLPRHWQLDQITPFEKVRLLDPQPHQKYLAQAVQALKAAFPAFANLKVAESWGGMIDATPDAVPVIDRLAQVPGLFLASGFSGHGFGLGPGAGKLMAEIVTGERPCVDPQAFRFTRFSDGTRPRPSTGL